MPDHIHSSVISEDRDDLVGFFRECSSVFSYRHNRTCHHSGPLMEHNFGSAPKFGDKKIRTNLIYVGNNPVERHLVKKAEEYQWNYLAYAADPFAFSKKPSFRESTYALRQAIREVKATAKSNSPMSYTQIQRLFKPLASLERKQLVDVIVNEYNIIDYKSAIKFFGNYGEMLIAMHATTGSEYDLNEVFKGRSDACYKKIATILMKELKLNDIHDVLALPDCDKSRLFPLLFERTDATPEQIADEIGPAPFRILSVWPKSFTAKNISFVSKTNTALKKKKIANKVLIIASLVFSSGLNDSIIKKIAIKNGMIKPITGRTEPL